ncbi:MAG: TetR/AcrR family transcriptional regulator [Hyphomonadaceae bacterium]|nr:TetR/AcrR family transcriptional regulator [Hyphomonadaceae bacterium]MBP9235058.1 TetR/AcrR family transcriptional regulator [Hyphomonadaceae bacterium]
MTTIQTTEKADPRETILKAAGDRILHYGYNKTTMSEIAADCGMSAGNIYRFYPSKIDIAEAMTRKFAQNSLALYEEIIRDAARSATRKMNDFFLARLERTFRVFEAHPKLMELAEIMGRERPEYMAEELAQERRQIEHILDEGQKSGDFALPADLTITADLVQCAMMKFRIPQLWTTEKLEALRAELEGVLSLIFTGLSARR